MEDKKIIKTYTVTLKVEVYNNAYGTLALENILAIFNEVNFQSMKALITEVKEG